MGGANVCEPGHRSAGHGKRIAHVRCDHVALLDAHGAQRIARGCQDRHRCEEHDARYLSQEHTSFKGAPCEMRVLLSLLLEVYGRR